jgi:hypothetical protein
MAEKVRLFMDGEELTGLVNFGEIVLERGLIEVPEFHKIRQIQSGIEKIPAIDVTFKIPRGSNIYKILKDWYFNDEVHDLVKVRCDATGTEFARTLLPSCEMTKWHEPGFDGANPTYAQIQTRFIPWDVIPTIE